MFSKFFKHKRPILQPWHLSSLARTNVYIGLRRAKWVAVYGQGKKAKADIALYGNPISELRDVICHGITQCYLPPDTSERAPPNPSQAGWYSIFPTPEGWKAE